MNYKHTQVGYPILFTLLFVILLFVIILTQTGLNLAILIIMTFIMLILVSFSSLKVTIDKNYLRIKFGYGIFRKNFYLKDITSVKVVKNHWYYGWGIRIWFWPRMLIFNVSGFNAVEIKLKSKKIYRIGTDEPKRLEDAIKKSLFSKNQNI